MSYAFSFDKEDDVYQFSYCYPYSYTRLQNHLDNIEKRNLDYVQRELLCLSVVRWTKEDMGSLVEPFVHPRLIYGLIRHNKDIPS